MNRLVLIDGNAILHRAYHALPPLTSPDGAVVNAVYGFATMLFRVAQDLKPTHIAVAFDRPKPTFRKELYIKYQLARPKMDDDLVSQIPKVHDLVSAFGIRIFEHDGFEADDVIGTLVKKAGDMTGDNAPDQVIIVTGDRDLLQLVDKKTLAYMPVKGLSEAKLYDEAATKERMGVFPRNIPDLKALAGDASDGYPGVAGIGPKTAADLINTYESVEKLYQEIKQNKKSVSDGVRMKLLAGEENAVLFKNIATIRTDVPIEADVSLLKLETLDTPDSRRALENFHFSSLLKRLTTMYNPEQPKEIKRTKKKSQAEHNEEQLSLI